MEVKDDLEAIIKQVGRERVKVCFMLTLPMLDTTTCIECSISTLFSLILTFNKIICCGPAGELEKIKPHMDGRLPIKVGKHKNLFLCR